MKKCGKILSIVLALSLVLSMTAVAATAPSTAEEKLLATIENLSKLTSFDAEVKDTSIVKKDVETTEVVATSKVSVALEPFQFACETTSTSKGATTLTKLFASTKEDKLVAYNFANGLWTAQEVADAEAFASETFGAVVTNFSNVSEEFWTETIKSYKFVGNDVIGGLNATVVEFTVSGDFVKEIVDLDAKLAGFGIDAADEKQAAAVEAFGEAVADSSVKFTIVIQDAKLFPAKITVDSTDLYNKLEKKMASYAVKAGEGSEFAQGKASDAVTVIKSVSEINFKNYNNASAVVVPDDALKVEVAPAATAEEAAPAPAAPAEETEAQEAEDADAAADADADTEGEEAGEPDADADGEDADADADAEGEDAAE